MFLFRSLLAIPLSALISVKSPKPGRCAPRSAANPLANAGPFKRLDGRIVYPEERTSQRQVFRTHRAALQASPAKSAMSNPLRKPGRRILSRAGEIGRFPISVLPPLSFGPVLTL
jgi:hypothetical protein